MTRTIALILLCCAPARAAEPQTFCKAEVGVVHDGDTLSLMIDLGWQIKYGWVQVRIDGMDAWEINRSRVQVRPFSDFTPEQWSEEIRKGTKAKDDLKELLGKGQLWVSPSKNRDPHGRVSARLFVQTAAADLIDVAQWMIAKGDTRR